MIGDHSEGSRYTHKGSRRASVSQTLTGFHHRDRGVLHSICAGKNVAFITLWLKTAVLHLRWELE